MWGTSPLVIILIAGEILVLVGLLVLIIYKKYMSLKEVLRSEKNKCKRVKKELNVEKSEKVVREKVSGYLVEQQKLTTKKIVDSISDEDSQLKSELFELRNQVLGCELTTLKKNSLDEGYWEEVVRGYETIRPNYKLATVVDENVVPVVAEEIEIDFLMAIDEANETEDIKKPITNANSVDFSDTATEQLHRLNGVISHQFSTIDELKKQIRDAEATQPDIAEMPFVNKLKGQLAIMEKGQSEMAMCLSVVENENDRLLAVLADYQNNKNTDDMQSGNNNAIKESPTSDDISESQLTSSKLIDKLTQENEENLRCISVLESEVDELHNRNTGLKTALEKVSESKSNNTELADLEVQGQLKETEGLVHRLSQTNKEHLQCISILESEVDALQEKITEKDALFATLMLDESSLISENNESSDQNRHELKLQLDAKMAEFELLQSDYESMKQRYIELFQQSRAS